MPGMNLGLNSWKTDIKNKTKVYSQYASLINLYQKSEKLAKQVNQLTSPVTALMILHKNIS